MIGWRKGILTAVGVLGLGLGTTTFAKGNQPQQQTQSQQQQKQKQKGFGGAGQMGQQAELKGTLVKKEANTLYLRLDSGAVAPVSISSNTQFQGLPQQAKVQQGQKALQWVAPGEKVTAEVMPHMGKNQARSIRLEQAKGEQQIEGTVARATSNEVYIQSSEGALIPLKVNPQTSLQGLTSVSQLKQGSQVRASFRTGSQGTDNIATRLEFQGGQQPGMGGAGGAGQKQQKGKSSKGGSSSSGQQQSGSQQQGGQY